MTLQATTFVEEGDNISPTWLNGPVGKALRASMAVQYDNIYSTTIYSVIAGLPTYGPADAITWAAQDRGILPGPHETPTHIYGRLRQWLVMAQFYGTPTGIMCNVMGYTSPVYPNMYTVSSSPGSTGTGITMWNNYGFQDPFPTTQSLPDPTFQQTFSAASSIGYWDWDSQAAPFQGFPAWWRGWLVIQSLSNSPWSTPTSTIGGFHLGDGTAINWGGTQADKSALQTIVHKWQGAHNTVPSILVAYADLLFIPGGGATRPDGTYGHWGKASFASITAGSKTVYSVAASGGYSSVYVPATPSTTASTGWGYNYVPARIIGPVSYIDGINP